MSRSVPGVGHREGSASRTDGRIQIPNRSNLEVDLKCNDLEKHPYSITNFLPLFAPGWERREGENAAQ